MGGTRAARLRKKTPPAPRAETETITDILGQADGDVVAAILADVLPPAPPPDLDARTRATLIRAFDALLTTDDLGAEWLVAMFPDRATWDEWRTRTSWLRAQATATPRTGRRPETYRDAVGTAVALAFLLAFDVQGKAHDAQGRERLTADRHGPFAWVYRKVCKDQKLDTPANWDTRTLGRCITSAKHRLATLLKDKRVRSSIYAASEPLPLIERADATALFRALFPREPRNTRRKTPPKG